MDKSNPFVLSHCLCVCVCVVLSFPHFCLWGGCPFSSKQKEEKNKLMVSAGNILILLTDFFCCRLFVFCCCCCFYNQEGGRMLDASFINSSLKSALGNGVEAVILLDGNGVLLSSASLNPEYVCQKEHSMIVAATGNVWRACARNDLTKNKLTNEIEPEALEQVLVDFGCRKICAMSVGGSAILCMVGTELEMGFLKLRTAALQRRLDGHLRPVLLLPS